MSEASVTKSYDDMTQEEKDNHDKEQREKEEAEQAGMSC